VTAQGFHPRDDVRALFYALRRCPMKIIGFEEHYGLPAIHEAAKKANEAPGLRTHQRGFHRRSSPEGIP
jgi:hypothetical protein